MKRITLSLFLLLGVILVFSSCAFLKSLEAPKTKQGGIYYDGEIKPVIVPVEFPEVNPEAITPVQIGKMTLMIVYEEDCGFVVYIYDFYVFGLFIDIQTDNPRYWIYDENGNPCEVTEEAFKEAILVWDNMGPPPIKQNTGLTI